MLILSKHHDYYDGVAHAGIDKTIVYKRLIKTFRIKSLPTYLDASETTTFVEVERPNEYTQWSIIPKGMEIELPMRGIGNARFTLTNTGEELQERGVILFCGKVYPYCKVRMFKGINIYSGRDYEYDIFYDNEGATKALLAAYIDHLKFGGKHSSWERDNLIKTIDRYDSSKNVMPSIDKWGNDLVLDLHRTLNSPLIYITNRSISTNINLKELHFQRVVDPYTAFQEISMFISGVLGNPEKETVSITDNDRVQQHGFDKWSFRKLPEKK